MQGVFSPLLYLQFLLWFDVELFNVAEKRVCTNDDVMDQMETPFQRGGCVAMDSTVIGFKLLYNSSLGFRTQNSSELIKFSLVVSQASEK